jgi:ketosteroid isomerase-like protein
VSGGPRTPEELETLLEDAHVLRDAAAVARLYEEDAVVADHGGVHARGPDEIARATADGWERDGTFVAALRHVVQARATALVIGARRVSVAHRGPDGAWRYAIALVELDEEVE